MDFGLGEKEEVLRQQIREFATQELPPDWDCLAEGPDKKGGGKCF